MKNNASSKQPILKAETITQEDVDFIMEVVGKGDEEAYKEAPLLEYPLPIEAEGIQNK